MTIFKTRGALLASGALFATTVGGPAMAQQAVAQKADPDQGTSGPDIIVTANKRAERIQDVALSITAVSGTQLSEQQLLDIQDLATRVPGLSFQRGGNGPNQRLIIRGLNTGGTGATVASVVDDVPLSFSSGSTNGADFATDFDPYDLDRVEVLKGPQGSLYGAAAEGGLIKYVTAAPDLNRFGGGFDVGALSLRHGDGGASGKAYVNIPIAEGVAAIRTSGYYEYSPGWITNGLGKIAEANGFRRYGGRVSILLKPTEALTVRGTAYYQQLDSNGPDTVEVFGVTTPTRAFDLYKGYNYDTYLPQPSQSRSQLYSLKAGYDFGPLTFESITSYGKLDTAFSFDTPLYVPLSGPFFGRPNTALISTSVSALEKFNQEVRLSSNSAAAVNGYGLDWQVGAFYTRETSRNANNYFSRDANSGVDVVTPLAIAVTPPGTSQLFLADLRAKYREIAGYADFTYHFSPAFDIEAGGRVFNNKQSYFQNTGGALFSPAAFQSSPTARSSETNGTFSVAPRFHFTKDAMIYARVASGYRPGGPNPAIPAPGAGEPATPPSSFKSDSTINYEVGLKASLFNRILTVDLTGFYIDWTNIQVTVAIPRAATGYAATVNAGKAVSKGVEWNIGVNPVRGLSLGWLGAYTDARLSSDIAAINGFKNNRLPYVPTWQTTLTADYEVGLVDDVKAYIGGSYSYIGERFSGFNFNPTLTHLPIPRYETFALRAGVRTKQFGLQVYGKNLGDTRGITNYGGGQTIFGVFIPGTATLIRPREIGVRLTGTF